MGDTPNDKPNAFERHYNRFKNDSPPLADSERALSDRVITQHLQNNYDNDEIPMDRIDFGVPGAIARVERNLIEASEANWNPDHSDGVVSDAINYVSMMIKGEEEQSPEQSASDSNARAFLGKTRTDANVVQEIITRTPALSGFSLDDAKAIARADMSDTDNGTSTLSKFPDADPNLVRAVAYTMLHANSESLSEADLQGQDFAGTARGYMHYSNEDGNAYRDWELDRRNAVLESLTGNQDFMADVGRIKAPQNIETADELAEQFAIRERIADTIATSFAGTYGISNILTKDDITVTYATRATLREDATGGYMAHKNIGILNDENMVVRYNPAAALMDNASYLATTDIEEAEFFLRASIEEVQHGVDQIYADKLVLGTLPENAPVDHHATMSALNYLTYAGGDPGAGYDDYANQYVESSAKNVAQDIAFELTYQLKYPEDADATQNANMGVDTPTVKL